MAMADSRGFRSRYWMTARQAQQLVGVRLQPLPRRQGVPAGLAEVAGRD